MSRIFLNLAEISDYTSSEVGRNNQVMMHGWRQQQYYEWLEKTSPELAEVARDVELLDPRKDENGVSDAYRGALLALVAFAEYAFDKDQNEYAKAEASADHLSHLDFDELAESYEAALENDLEEADSDELFTVVRERLTERYPALSRQIVEMIKAEDGKSRDYKRGMWFGAIRLLVAIDSTVEHEIQDEDLSDTWSAPTNSGSLD